jgi:hypothetical protein
LSDVAIDLLARLAPATISSSFITFAGLK